MRDNQNDSYKDEHGIYDDKGEQAFKVLYHKKRKQYFWLGIGLSILWMCCGAGLIFYAYSSEDPVTNKVDLIVLWVIWPVFALIMILLSIKTHLESARAIHTATAFRGTKKGM